MKKLVVISSAPLVFIKEEWFLYSPYEKEMQLWAKHSYSIQFCCPIWDETRNLLVTKVSFSTEKPIELKEFDIKSIKGIFKAISSSLFNIQQIYKTFKKADHIHLRCPGNVALLACFVQILFPNKTKTAKYAGNWDPNSRQPWSYRLQKWILSNTFLTKNMQVLVYGEWPNQTKNIKPFFTATYSEEEIKNSEFRVQNLEDTDIIKFLFVGTLVKGKQPLYALKLIHKLILKEYKVTIDFYGEGNQREILNNYIVSNNLQNNAVLKGNQTKEVVKKAYRTSHFLILPSKSEGWPKAVAEAMFWGSVPVATPVSCVPYMVDFGNRGVLLKENLEKDTTSILQLINNPSAYELKSAAAQKWSQQFTTDVFEKEIQKLLKA